jgi:anhydro-N-acetylmuramic acid kinase
MRVAGLISGTSVDGIDVAVCDIGDETITLVASRTVPYPPQVRESILAISNASVHVGEISRLNFLLGELFADALPLTFPLDTVELIGSHGQTIFHHRDSTLQIGEAAVIAHRTGKPVVADFRVADMAAGGLGAPLVPFLDYRLFRDPRLHRVALNIGGIANITVIPAAARPDEVVAFDTGPGNIVMDALASPFDRDGERARAGRVNEPLLAALLQDPWYRQPPPKTAGREQYGREFVERTKIDIATAAELTARTISLAIGRYPTTREVIVSGGGVHNLWLMERLRAILQPRLIPSSDLGVDIDAKEATLFALLAYETWHHRPGNLPSATGASKPKILGNINLP